MSLSSILRSKSRLKTLGVFVILCGPMTSVHAESAQQMVHLDGTAAFFEGREFGSAELVPIYSSDVDFEATLLLLEEHDESQSASSNAQSSWIRARRLAVMVRLLARQAKMLGETVSDVDINRLISGVTRRVGGSGSMSRLLARYGLQEQDLYQWAANTLLASNQIQGFVEQSGILVRRDDNLKEQDNSTVRAIPKRRLVQAITSWIQNLVDSNRVRIPK